MKKIPPGSEASNVLVGEVDFLSHPIIAFVRLANSQVLGDLTEIPIPTRFLFILLGPKGNRERFHEIGRSIATLMSDEVCVLTSMGQLLLGIPFRSSGIHVGYFDSWTCPHFRSSFVLLYVAGTVT